MSIPTKGLCRSINSANRERSVFHFPHEFIADCRRSDRFIVLGEFHVDLDQILPHEIEERVDVCGFLGTSCGAVIFRIPDFDAHFVFGAELASGSVDGQTNVNDRLPLCIDFVFSNEEKKILFPKVCLR